MDFRPPKKNMSLFRAPSYLVFVFVALFHQRNGNFRRVLLLSQIFTSICDPRQDGQSSFTTSSSQKGNGTREYRASLVAEREEPSLVEDEFLWPPLFAF